MKSRFPSGTTLSCALALLPAAGLASAADITATLQRTAYGVVHIKADDFKGIGLGAGYAYATDNHCLLAHRVAQVNGRLSEQLGADTVIRTPLGNALTALESDRYHLGWFDINAIRDGFAAGSEDARQLAEGYAAGVNRHLAEKPTGFHCQVEFTRNVTADDVYRMWVATADLPSLELLAPYLAGTHPGNAAPAATANYSTTGLAVAADTPVGSNAWAFGRDTTRDGSSVHFYNPHFPWYGINRLYLIHVTVPGKLDVMGPALGGFPIPLAGFSRRIAWGLTVSAAARFTIAELKLVAGNPLAYTVDGAREDIVRELIAIPVRGEASPRIVPFYRARTGPVINAPGFFLAWSSTKAYAVQDVNQSNTRMVEQALRVAMSDDVHGIHDALKAVQGNPWSYLSASDADGEVLFADISATPDASSELDDSCQVPFLSGALRGAGVFLLNGSRGECRWQHRMAPDQQPLLIRSDYVANSNNNYELPNLHAPLTGYSPIFGGENQALSLRAGLGLRMIQQRLNGTDGLGAPGFTAELARAVFHQERNLSAELLVDEIVDDCLASPVGAWNGNSVDLTSVCSALDAWDRRQTVESRGAHVYSGLIAALKEQNALTALFKVAPSLNEPLTTPSGYNDAPQFRENVRNALARISLSLADQGISPTAAWGEVHKVKTPSGEYGLPGGDGIQGVFDVLVDEASASSYAGWEASLYGSDSSILNGVSYLHSVKLTPNGPTAFGLMPYSQATEADSPWYLDQLPALSNSAWFQFPFTAAAIAADPQLTTLRLSSAFPMPGDLDGDDDIDQLDLHLILGVRNQRAAGANDPRDLDKNGVLNVLDARKLALLCTRPRCTVD